ncbi:MAG: mechanosensitive ion channel family protein [Holophagaceae bacterium]|nr:mechanosensitive ion channel family protein [Holophagaceae bacterium]
MDESPLQTARSLAPFAITPQEQQFFLQAERLGNHAVDLAYTDALLMALDSPRPLSPEAVQLQAAKKKAEAAVEADQHRITQLTRDIPLAKGAEQDSLEDQLDVVKAQLELDQDDLDDVAAELEAAGGDPQAKVRRLKAAHEASDRSGKIALPPAMPWVAPTGSLLNKTGLWFDLKRKSAKLAQAQSEARARAQRMTDRRPKLVERVEKGREARDAVKQKAQNFGQKGQKGQTSEEGTSKEAAKATVHALRRHMADQRLLSDLGKRIQDQKELGEVYENWITLTKIHSRATLHSIMKTVLLIMVLLLAILLGGRLIDRIFIRTEEDRGGTSTPGTILKFVWRVLGTFTILFVIVGMPTQTSTILGLVGAGLTVAMKDFIVAFFGWFVLIGKNGLRVGDWVEIKGVGGEVVEVGLLRTVLLETGNWSDAAHPTGRRVTFANSFAIEGHFFNFSTSGQWMWDEVRATIPAGQDPYPIIASIQKLVEEQTKANAELAETEWQRTTTRYRVHAFSTVPGIHSSPPAKASRSASATSSRPMKAMKPAAA